MYRLYKETTEGKTVFHVNYGYCGCCVQSKASAPEPWQENEDVDLIEEKDIQSMEKFFQEQSELLKQLKETRK